MRAYCFCRQNDIEESSILEALDIFFNDGKGNIKIDKDDINKPAALEGNKEISISVCFNELPKSIIIDATNETTLQSEYLLNMNTQLEIIKKYPNAKLKGILDQQSIDCHDRVKKAVIQTASWNRQLESFVNNIMIVDNPKAYFSGIDKMRAGVCLLFFYASNFDWKSNPKGELIIMIQCGAK